MSAWETTKRIFGYPFAVMERKAAEEQARTAKADHLSKIFEASSRMWLRKNKFPAGPLFTSDVMGLLSGSGTSKMPHISSRVHCRPSSLLMSFSSFISEHGRGYKYVHTDFVLYNAFA